MLRVGNIRSRLVVEVLCGDTVVIVLSISFDLLPHALPRFSYNSGQVLTLQAEPNLQLPTG